jgi:hypothetical protein
LEEDAMSEHGDVDEYVNMTAEQFKAAMGVDPKPGDLERANCPQAGLPGHVSCGMCECGAYRPIMYCERCLAERAEIVYGTMFTREGRE